VANREPYIDRYLDPEHWAAYQEVNERFGEVVLDEAPWGSASDFLLDYACGFEKCVPQVADHNIYRRAGMLVSEVGTTVQRVDVNAVGTLVRLVGNDLKQVIPDRGIESIVNLSRIGI
jgi:hypothetical protein